jgi:lysophospholipase L1-like esterase
MDHMTAVGVSGLDLYVRHEGEWKWLAVGRPTQALNESELFVDLPVARRDYMLYLPLYHPIQRVELGIPGDYELAARPLRKKSTIVFYGTSITQGGCASRPGMCYTAILGRWLDRPTINLGFSGNGVMDPEVIDLLCELDAAMYVLDCLPNMQAAGVDEREEGAIRKLRGARPETPIVLVDHMLYCDAFLKKDRMARYAGANEAQREIYERLVREGMERLYRISDDALIGVDGEATVDGTHFTDLGYMRFSESLVGVLRGILNH